MKALIWNSGFWVEETDPTALKTIYFARLNKANFKILQFIEHNFEPQGYSAIWLLAESHLAIHTFPEEQLSYIEISSCVREQFDEFMKRM